MMIIIIIIVFIIIIIIYLFIHLCYFTFLCRGSSARFCNTKCTAPAVDAARALRPSALASELQLRSHIPSIISIVISGSSSIFI